MKNPLKFVINFTGVAANGSHQINYFATNPGDITIDEVIRSAIAFGIAVGQNSYLPDDASKIPALYAAYAAELKRNGFEEQQQ